MTPERWRQIQALFEEALLRGDGEREAFLAEACGADPALRAEVLVLLSHHARGEREHFLPSRTATPALPSAPLPSCQVPGYEVLGELGRGGMGIVYRARHRQLNREVALKMILAGEHAGPSERARFRTEAQALACLQHPNIVQIFDVGEHDGRLFFAMELVPGGSLRDRLAGRPLSAHGAAGLTRVLAGAVHAAHERGIIHRDLKPSNILLADSAPANEEEWTLKISDFSLARRAGPETDLTRTGAILGTPSYMAPEQAAGSKVGPPADVYALGAILYQMLTTQVPFRGAGPLETLEQVRTREPARPRALRRGLPRDLETICLKCLRKEPAERYASAADLADDLRRFLRGEPVLARPLPGWRLAARWARRNPAASALLAAIVLLALTVTLGSLWYSVRLGEALQEARAGRILAERSEQQARLAAYASDMLRAQQSLRLGNPFVLSDLLDRHLPAEGEGQDRRGFEWWYLSGYRQPAPRAWSAHNGQIVWLAYSPDGSTLATVGDDPGPGWSVKVWEIDGRECRLRVPLRGGAKGGGPPAAFAPGGAGWLAVIDDTGVTRWDLKTKQQVGRRLDEPGNRGGVAVTAGGRQLVTGGDRAITVWDVNRQAVVRSLPASAGAAVNGLALSPDGRTLAACSPGAGLALWELKADRPRLPLHGASADHAPLFSPGGSLLAVIDRDGRVALWDGEGRPHVPWVNRPRARARAVVLTPDERTLAVGGDDGTLALWDVPGRSCLAELRWQASPITALACSPDGRELAVATLDGMVYRLAPPGRLEPQRLRPRFDPEHCLAWSPDGRLLAIADADRTVTLLDASSGLPRLVLRGHLNQADSLVFSPDGGTLASVESHTDRVLAWDVTTGRRRPLPEEVLGTRLAFGPGSVLDIARRNSIRILNVGTASACRTLTSQNPDVTGLAFAADGKALAALGTAGVLERWDLAQGSPPSSPQRRQLGGKGTCLAYLPDGRTIVTGQENGQVRFWRPGKEGLTETRKPLVLEAELRALDVSPDGRRLLTCSHGNWKPQTWDLKTFEVVYRLPFDAEQFGPARLRPDGRQVAARASNGAVQLWDLDTWLVRTLPGQPFGTVRSLAFGPDGRTLVTGSDVLLRSRRGFTTLRGFPALPRPAWVYDSLALQPAAASVRVWDAAARVERAGPAGPGLLCPPTLVTLSPDGRTLAAGAKDGSVYLWDRASNRPARRLFASALARRYAKGAELASHLYAVQPVYPEPLVSLAFSSDGRHLMAATSHGTVTVWDTEGWQEVRRLSLPEGRCTWAGFSPGGDLVTVDGGAVQFRNPLSGAVRSRLGERQGTAVTCLAFTPDGSGLAVAYRDYHIRLWEPGAGRERAVLLGHQDRVNALAYSPDGRTLASASSDRTVKLWCVAVATEVATLQGHAGKVHALAFAPDGSALASGGDAGQGRGEVLLWRAGPATPSRR